MPWVQENRGLPWRTLARLGLSIALLVLLVYGVAVVQSLRDPARRIRKLTAQAELHRRLGQLDEAAAAIEEALAAGGEDGALSVNLAALRWTQGRRGDAHALLAAVHARRPKDTAVAVARARFLLEDDRPFEAAEALEPRVADLRRIADPAERTDALFVAGRAATGRGALLEAEALYREASRVGPAPVTALARSAAQALLALGDLYLRSGRPEQAAAALHGARTLTPWDTRIAVAHARALELHGQTEAAVAELLPLVRGTPRPDPWAAVALGDLLVRAGRLDEAEQLALGLSVSAVGSEVSAGLEASIALATADAPRARRQAEQLAIARPGGPDSHVLGAHVALLAGDLARARAELEAAERSSPGLLAAELGLLEVCERAGDVEALRGRALRLLERPDLRPWASRALVTLAARDPAPALAAIERLTALAVGRPRDVRLRVHLGLFRLAAGQPEAAAVDLGPLIEAHDVAAALATLAEDPDGAAQALVAFEQLVALPRAREARPDVLARALEALGRPALAATLLTTTNEVSAEHEALALAARLALAADDLPRARRSLEALLAADPADGAALAALGEVQAALGDVALARSTLQRAAEALPTSGIVRARLARTLAQGGDRLQAAAEYAQARRLAPRVPLVHEGGLLSLLGGDLAAASARLSEGLGLTSDPRLALALAATFQLLGRSADSAALLASGSGTIAEPERTVLAALAHAAAGDLERARATMRAAGAPAVVRDACARGGADRTRLLELVALAAVGWREEALARARTIAGDARADAAELWLGWRIARAAADAPLALRVAEALARLDAEDLELALALADARGRAGDAAGARAVLGALVARRHEAGPLLTQLGMALERVDELPGAIACYRDALARAPRDAVAHNDLAWLLGTAAPPSLDEALEHAREAARLAPAVPEVQDTLGWLLHLKGHHREARLHLERAAAQLPSVPTVRYHLAVVLEALGLRDAARLALEVALRLPGAWPEQEAARARLARLAARMP